MEQDVRPIVIGTKNIGQILLAILRRGSVADEMQIIFTDKFVGDAEYTLRLLRKNGWKEIGREKTESINTKCIHDEEEAQIWSTVIIENGKKIKKQEIRKIRVCSHPEMNPPKGCNENLRNSCPFHKPKYKSKIPVTQVTIEKLPQMRGL